MRGHIGTHHGQSSDTCLLNSNGEVLVPRPACQEKGPRVPSVYGAEARQADRGSVPTRGRNTVWRSHTRNRSQGGDTRSSPCWAEG